jgi:hypothetical protein
MTRGRPVRFEFGTADDAELIGHLSVIRSAGTGWINIEPIIAEEHEPPQPGPFAFLGGSTHKVPTITWLPAGPAADGGPRPTTVGIQHAGGPHLSRKLRDLGLPIPEGWRVTQDHPRRGWVALVPGDAEDRSVVRWLLQAAAAVCAVPTTGQWWASVFTGLAR